MHFGCVPLNRDTWSSMSNRFCRWPAALVSNWEWKSSQLIECDTPEIHANYGNRAQSTISLATVAPIEAIPLTPCPYRFQAFFFFFFFFALVCCLRVFLSLFSIYFRCASICLCVCLARKKRSVYVYVHTDCIEVPTRCQKQSKAIVVCSAAEKDSFRFKISFVFRCSLHLFWRIFLIYISQVSEWQFAVICFTKYQNFYEDFKVVRLD